MDISSDKQTKSHTRKLGFGSERELREKLNLIKWQHKITLTKSKLELIRRNKIASVVYVGIETKR